MKKLLIPFLSLVMLTGKSQSAWDLQQCINYALSHNISLQQAGLNNEVNKNNTNQSKAAALPSINAGVSHVYNFGKTVNGFTKVVYVRYTGVY